MKKLKQNNTSGSANISNFEICKITQKKKILSFLRLNGYTSAPELCIYFKISLPTCIAWLNDLILSGNVVNIGTGQSSGGRKPNLYGLPENGYYAIVCDIGRYCSSITIMDCFSKFVTPIIQISTNADDSLLVDKLFEETNKLLNHYHIPDERIYGLGVYMPGLINSEEGINYSIKDITRRNIGRDLKRRYNNKMIYIDNDARMHAFGELYFGSAKAYRNAIVIHWSWGIAFGIIVNGQLCKGKNGFAGEFSHIPIVENGELCMCGKRGCLETIGSSTYIMKRVKQGFADHAVTSLINQFENHPEMVTPEDVIHLARHGDEFCISILNEVGSAMGKGLSYIIQLLNPEAIIFSGPISKAKQYVLSPIQQSINRFCIERISGSTKLVVSEMGDRSAFLGTCEMIFQKVFNEIDLPVINHSKIQKII